MGESKFNLVLTFKTTGGANANITIQDADQDVTKTQVGNLMDIIIAQNIFMTKGGEFKSKVSAKLVETSNQLFELK